MKIMLDKDDYRRMIQTEECDEIDKNLSYTQFLDWNIKCIDELSDEDKLFLRILCNKISNKNIGQMDLESCVVFTTCSIFFDKNKKLIIVNPR
jgi:hypothetical protein